MSNLLEKAAKPGAPSTGIERVRPIVKITPTKEGIKITATVLCDARKAWETAKMIQLASTPGKLGQSVTVSSGPLKGCEVFVKFSAGIRKAEEYREETE